MRPSPQLRRFVALALVPFPSSVKVVAYRHLFGYSIGRRVRIGLSAVDVSRCSIGDDVVIGHGNLLVSVSDLTLGAHSQIGHLNLIRGGQVSIGRQSEILRMNEINAGRLPEGWPTESALSIGDRTSVTTGHKIDFTGSVTIGNDVVLAGRNSSLWTHARGLIEPITIADRVYLGSEVRLAPGCIIPANCIVGMGSVVIDPLGDYEGHLIAGVPARPKRPVNKKDALLLQPGSVDEPL